jgi:hypothetical protein
MWDQVDVQAGQDSSNVTIVGSLDETNDALGILG